MLSFILCTFLVLLLIRFILSSDPPKRNGIYSERGKWYWLKYFAFLILYNLRKHQNKQKRVVSGTDAGYGMRSRSSVEDMDQVQELPQEHHKAVDAVYFNGASCDGKYFVGATARRHKKLTQTLLYIRLPGIGLLELPSLPDTSLYRQSEMEFSAGGFRIEVVEAMKKWKLSYNGNMRLNKEDMSNKESSNVKVTFSLDWVAYTKLFDFDTDLHPASLCDAIAREKWSRELFDNLKKAHQTHYEQFGEISGTVHIEGFNDVELKVQGVRDHSYGNVRDWRDLHRYGIQYLHLKDGTAICIGLICFPATFSRLTIGYVMHPDGRMDAVRWTDFEFFRMGDDGIPPDHFQFNFKTDKDIYHLKGDVLDAPVFYMGLDWEARIHERMCTFEVNGIKGWGISEWDYRNRTGKPADHSKEE